MPRRRLHPVYLRDGELVMPHENVRLGLGIDFEKFDRRIREALISVPNFQQMLLGLSSSEHDDIGIGWTEQAILAFTQDRAKPGKRAMLLAAFEAAKAAPELVPPWPASDPSATEPPMHNKGRPTHPDPHREKPDVEAEISPQPPVVFNRDRETLTTSLAVAAAYGKAHKNVLAAIDEILLEMGLKLSPSFLFRETTYLDKYGRQKRMVEMNEDAFSLLVGGFTGAEALRFRVAYIVEFKRMQKALQDQDTAPPQDFNDPAFLRQMLIGYTYQLEASRAETADERARRIAAETKAAAEAERALQQQDIAARERVAREAAEADKEKMAPKAEYFDDLVDRAGLYSYTAAAKLLGVGRSYLITMLLNPPLKWHYRFNGRGKLHPYEPTITKDRYMATQSRRYPNGKTGELEDEETARITEKGIEFLRQYLKSGPFRLVS